MPDEKRGCRTIAPIEPISPTERRTWAVDALIAAVRRSVQAPHDPALTAALWSRLRELDAADRALLAAPRSRSGRRRKAVTNDQEMAQNGADL